MPYWTYEIKDSHSFVVKILPRSEAAHNAKGKLALGNEPITDEIRAAMPNKLIIGRRYPEVKSGPLDIMRFSVSDWIVSERVKAKLKELDPGYHEFFRLETEDEFGKIDYPDMYYFACTAHIDCLDIERTYFQGPGRGFGKPSSGFTLFRQWSDKYPITLRRESLYQANFWRGAAGAGGVFNFFCSDKFHDWLLESGINSLECYETEVWPPVA